MNPVFKYSSRTYNTALNDINSNSELKDKPSWWKSYIAGAVDLLSMVINGTANQLYLETVTSETAGDRLLALLDYQRASQTTSTGSVIFYITRSATLPFTLTVADLVAYSQGSISVATKRFEARASVTFSAFSETFTANLSTNLLTVAHVYTTGDLVRVSASVSLPTASGGGLSAATDYYVIYVGATTIYLARTLTDAYNGTYIDLTGNGSGTLTITLYSKTVTMYQQNSVASYAVGQSDGVTAWQKFNLSDTNILPDTISVIINSVTYTKQTTLVYSISTDTHFKHIIKTDGSSYIKFGDGIYGKIPPANYDILVSYSYGGGVDSNVSTQNKINVYGGSSANISGVSNSGYFTGGANKESLQNAKEIAPMQLKARDRFITVEDGKALCLSITGVERATIIPNFYGVLSCQVVIVPTGGDVPGAALLTEVATYLIDRSEFGSVYVVAIAPTYIIQAFTSVCTPKTGYTLSLIKPLYELAIKFLISEMTSEIYNYYLDNGIEYTVTYINTLWSTAFTSLDYSNIATLLQLIKYMNLIPDFEETLAESQVMAYLMQVPGVDYITISVPSFPVTLAADEIFQVGAITTT